MNFREGKREAWDSLETASFQILGLSCWLLWPSPLKGAQVWPPTNLDISYLLESICKDNFEYVKYHPYSCYYMYIYIYIHLQNESHCSTELQAWSTTPLTHWRLMTPQACHCHDGRNPQDQRDLSFILGFPKWKRLLVACCGPLWSCCCGAKAVMEMEIWHVSSDSQHQDSECAQCISLAKHNVVKTTVSKAVASKPSSMRFHAA